MRAPAFEHAAIDRFVRRGEVAESLVAAGRHAAAERVLRETCGALVRRQAWSPAAGMTIMLGRLLLERGRATDALATFADAEELALREADSRRERAARLWQVAALTDAGRLSHGERLCRDELDRVVVYAGQHAWAAALHARLLLWQERSSDLVPLPPPPDDELPGSTRAFVRATGVRVLLALSRYFEAGHAAREAMTAVDPRDPMACVIAHGAHLEVLAATGDLTLLRAAFRQHVELARAAHAPLRLARARIVWHDALWRAGAVAEASGELRRLARLGPAAPVLLQRAITARLSGPRLPTVDTGLESGPRYAPAALIDLAQRGGDPRHVLGSLLGAGAGHLRTGHVSISVVRGDGSFEVVAGPGDLAEVSAQVVDRGCPIRCAASGACDVAVPIRFGAELAGVAAARWPTPDQMPPDGLAILECLAALAAPHVDAVAAVLPLRSPDAREAFGLVGISTAIDVVRRGIVKAARAPFTVLIEGESGVGKELVARAIHAAGPRRAARFLDLNCAALPDDLLDSELFGHARGAFTGALTDRAGLFEQANGGTLFLDEVADLSPRAQAKLLRAIQQQEVRRVGETTARPIDVRLVAAANRDMRAEAAAGRFRTDLLYRLDVLRIRVPPLRDRVDDIPALALHFWTTAAERVGSSAVLGRAVLAALATHPWPGNVRELQNVIAALAVAAPRRGLVTPALLSPEVSARSERPPIRLADARSTAERQCVERALAAAGGSRTAAARELGLSRQGLLKVMARLGVEGL